MKTPFGLLALGLLLLASSAHAQSPGFSTFVTQTASRADAAAFWVGQANGATSCNTVSQTATQDTITIPAGQGSIYLTGLIIQNSFNATGVTQTGTLSFTGIPTVGGNSPFLSFASVLNTSSSFTPPFVIPFVPPLKALAGTAVTIVPSATQSADNYLCMSALGYYAQ